MSKADDILFEPITNTLPGLVIPVDEILLHEVAAALKGTQDIEFSVDPALPIDLYYRIADLVVNDPDQIVFLRHMVFSTALRPSNALTIKDVFYRTMAGEMDFYHCGQARTGGSRVGAFRFKNKFGIAARHPYLMVEMKGGGCFEWWAASLIPGYAGHLAHYSFGTRDEADKYYHNKP